MGVTCNGCGYAGYVVRNRRNMLFLGPNSDMAWVVLREHAYRLTLDEADHIVTTKEHPYLDLTEEDLVIEDAT